MNTCQKRKPFLHIIISAAAFTTLRQEFRGWLKVDEAEFEQDNSVQNNLNELDEDIQAPDQTREIPNKERRIDHEQSDEIRNDAIQTTTHQPSFLPADVSTSTSRINYSAKSQSSTNVINIEEERWCYRWWSRLKAAISPPAQGYTRLFYTCSCGDVTSIDVKETSPGSIDAIRQRLRSSALAAADFGCYHGASLELAPREPPRAHARSGDVVESRAPRSMTPAIEGSSYPEARQMEHVSATTATNGNLELQFLLLCVDVKEIAVLTQVEVSSFSSDQFLFREIRNVYEKTIEVYAWNICMIFPQRVRNALSDAPKFLSRIYQAFSSIRFHRIASGDFVRFQLVPIGDKAHPTWFTPEFPPETEVITRRYIYEPVPMGMEIINIPLAHLLKSREHHDRFWLSTFPRKLNEELRRPAGTSQPIIGWGIRINQTLNWAVVLSALLFLLIVISAIVIVYSVATGDNSAAFGLGAYLAALLTVWLTYHYFSWKEDL